MKQKSEVMKKLNGKLRMLKSSPLFKYAELNSTSARVQDKKEKEDYVLILNMKKSNDSFAISVNYKEKSEDDASIVVSRAEKVYDPENGFQGSYRSEKIVRSEPLSFSLFSEKLRTLNKSISYHNEENIIKELSELMNVYQDLTPSRPKMR